jgi:hypothetical protein
MIDQAPVLDVFISRHASASRLYLAPGAWCPPILRTHLDSALEAFPVARVDLDELERHMWNTDAPYERAVTRQGGVHLFARGRSAVSLLVWLAGLLEASNER